MKRKQREAFFVSHPLCCYCGNPATTIEHCPPKVLFAKGGRPKGWEFPACSPCNNGTGPSDQVFTLIVSLGMLEPSTADEKNQKRLAISVGNNDPHVLFEITRRMSTEVPDFENFWQFHFGDLIQWHIDRLVDKMTISAYYRATGKLFPPEYYISHLFLTNQMLIRGYLDEAMARLEECFPECGLLAQGIKTTKGHFEFRLFLPPDGGGFFIFYLNTAVVVAILARNSEDATKLGGDWRVRKPMKAVRPNVSNPTQDEVQRWAKMSPKTHTGLR